MNARRFFLLFAAILGGSDASAQAAAASAATWTVTPAVVSQYMFRGVRIGGPSLQPAIEFDQGDWALGIWANFPLRDKVPGQSDPELDPYGSYKIGLNDAGQGALRPKTKNQIIA